MRVLTSALFAFLALLSTASCQQLDSTLPGSSAGASFESPELSSPNFVLNPATSPTQPWTWTTGQGGIARFGSSYDAPLDGRPPHGSQYAFLTTSPGGAANRQSSEMSTTLTNLVAGRTYSLTFTWGLRAASQGSSLPGYQTRSQLNVSIAATNVYTSAANLTDDYGWATSITTRSFTASGTTAQLVFSVRSLSTEDHTVLIDAIEVGPGLPATGVINVQQMANFESPYPLGNGYQYNPPVTVLQQWVWTPTGLGGIAGIGSPFESGPTRYSPSGNQFGFMQTMNNNRRVSNMSCTLTGLITGQQYRVKGFISARWDSGNGYNTQSQTTLYYAGVPIWQSVPNISGFNNWYAWNATFTAPAMNGPLVFNTIATADNDRSVLIDSVVIEPVNARAPLGRLSATLSGHSTANSFEAPPLTGAAYGQGLSIQNFVYNPEIAYNQPWSFTDRLGGIARVGSPFDASPNIPPDGAQYAFIQTGLLNTLQSSIWTNVSDLVVGNPYSVTFSWGIRTDAGAAVPGYITPCQVVVTIGGTEVYRSAQNLSDADGWQNSQVSTLPWTATSTTALLKFDVNSLAFENHTFLFDAIDIGPPRPLEDFLNVGESSDFESPYPVNTVVWNPPQTILQQWAWTPANMGGIATMGSFNAPRPPTPNQFAVLKTAAGSATARMSTLLQGIIVGQTYRLTFWMANRNVGASQESVKLNDATVWTSGTSFSNAEDGFKQFTVTFVATGTSAGLAFETVSSTAQEQYVFIDSVLVMAVSAPRSGSLNSRLGGSSIPNSFEFPMLDPVSYGPGITMQDVMFNPPLSALCPWTFTQGRGGVAIAGSSFRSPAPSNPPAGDQWGWLMTSPANMPFARNATMTATVTNLVASRAYVVSFSWGLRYTNTRTNAQITVSANGVRIWQSASNLADDFAWGDQVTSNPFVAPGSSITLQFLIESTSDQETVILFDAVDIFTPSQDSGQLQVGTLGNFESPCCEQYIYGPAVTVVQPFWWSNLGGGVARQSPFDAVAPFQQPPSQGGYAFIQTPSGGSLVSNMSTTITGLIGGQSYTLSFFLNVRWDNGLGASTRSQINVWMGNTRVWQSVPDFNATQWVFVSVNFVPPTANALLTFNVVASATVDRSILVDSVLVRPVNFVAPGTLSVLLGGSSTPNSFESPVLDGSTYGLGVSLQSYVYGPMKTLTQPWEWTPLQGGIALLGSPFDAPAPSAPPAGKQYAWLQTSPNHATGMRSASMWTTLADMVVGQRYSVVFTWGIRAAAVQGEPGLITQSRIFVRVNNVIVFQSLNNLTDTAGWGEQESSQAFIATATTAELRFTVESATDRDHTILIDAVDVAPPLPNAGTMAVNTLGGFESPYPVSSFVANPAVNALQPWVWTPRNKGGVVVVGAGYDAPAPSRPPSPNQFAILRLNSEMSSQPQAGNMSTIISGMISGQSYNLTFYMATKLAANTVVMQSQERVYLDNRQLWAGPSGATSQQPWTHYTVVFSATSTAAMLTFSSISTTTNERMVLIDSVLVTPTSFVQPTGFLDALAPRTSAMCSFESPVLVGSTYGEGATMQDFLMSPPITANMPWTFTPADQGGIAMIGSIYQAAEPRQPPHGQQFAILVTTPTSLVASMSTVISNLVAGQRYQIQFEWGTRALASQTQSRLSVNVGGNNVYRSNENLSDDAGWGNTVTTQAFTATGTNTLLQISINSLAATRDDTLLIDTVVVITASSSTAGPQPGRSSSSATPSSSSGSVSTSSTGGPGASSNVPSVSSSTADVGGGDTSFSSSSSLSGGAIAGIVIGVVGGVACTALCLFFVCCGSRGSQKWQRHNDHHAEPSQNPTGEASQTHAETDEVEMA